MNMLSCSNLKVVSALRNQRQTGKNSFQKLQKHGTLRSRQKNLTYWAEKRNHNQEWHSCNRKTASKRRLHGFFSVLEV